jgi:hypothetical protein
MSSDGASEAGSSLRAARAMIVFIGLTTRKKITAAIERNEISTFRNAP